MTNATVAKPVPCGTHFAPHPSHVFPMHSWPRVGSSRLEACMESATIKKSLGEGAYGFYREALARLHKAQIEFMVGGAYAFGHYTGIFRDTKDFDVFVRPDDCRRALDLFSEAGFH